MTYGNFKDLPQRIASEICALFDKRFSSSGFESEIMSVEELAK